MVNQKKVTNLWCERGVLNYSMSNDVDKSGQSCGFKLKMAGRCGDLFKRRFYMNVSIMWRVHSGQPKVTSGILEERGIASRGEF